MDRKVCVLPFNINSKRLTSIGLKGKDNGLLKIALPVRIITPIEDQKERKEFLNDLINNIHHIEYTIDGKVIPCNKIKKLFKMVVDQENRECLLLPHLFYDGKTLINTLYVNTFKVEIFLMKEYKKEEMEKHGILVWENITCRKYFLHITSVESVEKEEKNNMNTVTADIRMKKYTTKKNLKDF